MGILSFSTIYDNIMTHAMFAMHTILGCRYSPEGRSSIHYCPPCILCNMGFVIDKLLSFEEVLDNLNRTDTNRRPFGIQTTVHLKFR